MKSRRIALATVIAIVLLERSAFGDEPAPLPSKDVVLKVDGVMALPSGRAFRVPARAHILTPDAYSALDLEMRRLQETETRLAAENESFRKSAEAWRPGWVVVTSAIVTGLAGGIYLGSKL